MKNPENSGDSTKKKKTCHLYLQISHHLFVYKVFENKYHINPLPKNDCEARAILAKIQSILYGSLIFIRKIDDTRQILKVFPN